MPSNMALVLGSLGAAYIFFSALLHYTQDSNEPPAVETSIPFISPLFGLIPGMPKFLVQLRDKHDLPIFTLRMPGQRIYVVNALPLIASVQRQFKAIAFAPIEAQAAATVMGVGPAGNAIIGSEKMLESNSYLSTFVPFLQPALAPGPGLDALIEASIRWMAASLANLARDGPRTVELFSWVRRQLFMATTESIYGPRNPFRDPKLEEAWYTFEPGIMVHMLKAVPPLLARRSLHAREHLLIPAFENYFADNGHIEGGSLLVQCRHRHNTTHGLRGRDVAATEVGQMVASLTNTVASAFWMVYHVFSDREVLEACRAEIEELARTDSDTGVSTIDLAQVKTSCPVLLSTWQETLRHVHIGISARVVMEDTMLENKFLLKKGATVMTAAPVHHSDPSLWGATVDTFDHRRFLRRPGEKRSNPAAFRPFGGATVLCPGRHFVSIEVMAFVALLLLRFDLKPLAKDGRWHELRKDNPMTSSMPTPKDEVPVEIVPRDKGKQTWSVHFSAMGKGLKVVAEDEAGGRDNH